LKIPETVEKVFRYFVRYFFIFENIMYLFSVRIIDNFKMHKMVISSAFFIAGDIKTKYTGKMHQKQRFLINEALLFGLQA
jgi:hypothetical protein